MKIWWRYFRAHDVKSGVNALIVGTEEEGTEVDSLPADWHVRFGKSADALKLACFYVDFEEGHFVLPEEQVEEANSLAIESIRFAERSLETHKRRMQSRTPESHAEYRTRAEAMTKSFVEDPAKLEESLAVKGSSPEARSIRRIVQQMRDAKSRD
jgi:hypothetical protein